MEHVGTAADLAVFDILLGEPGAEVNKGGAGFATVGAVIFGSGLHRVVGGHGPPGNGDWAMDGAMGIGPGTKSISLGLFSVAF